MSEVGDGRGIGARALARRSRRSGWQSEVRLKPCRCKHGRRDLTCTTVGGLQPQGHGTETYSYSTLSGCGEGRRCTESVGGSSSQASAKGQHQHMFVDRRGARLNVHEFKCSSDEGRASGFREFGSARARRRRTRPCELQRRDGASVQPDASQATFCWHRHRDACLRTCHNESLRPDGVFARFAT